MTDCAGIIYKLSSPSTEDVYYGSTMFNANNRFCRHKAYYRNYLEGKPYTHYCTYFELLKHDDCIIEIVETVVTASKKELNIIEGKYIKNNPCVNKQVAGRTRAEYAREYRKRPEVHERILVAEKKYREKNKEKNRPKKLIRDREYYQKTKARQLAKQAVKYTCVCGDTISTGHKSGHEKTVRHKYFIEHGSVIPKPEGNVFVLCECGAKVQKYSLPRHKKSKTHIRILQKK